MVFPRFSMVFPRFSMVFPWFFHGFSKVFQGFPWFFQGFPLFFQGFPWFFPAFPWFSTSIEHPVATPSVSFSGWPKLLEAFKRAWCRSGWPNKRLLAWWILIPRRGDLAEKKPPEMSREPWGVDRILLMLIDEKRTDRRSNERPFVSWGIGISIGMTFFVASRRRALQYPVVSTRTGCLFWPPKELSRKSHPSEGVIETFHPANEGRVWGTLHSVIWYLHIPTMVDWFLNHFTTASTWDWSLWWLQKFLVSPGMIGAPVIPSFWLVKKWWGSHVWCWLVVPDMGMGQN